MFTVVPRITFHALEKIQRLLKHYWNVPLNGVSLSALALAPLSSTYFLSIRNACVMQVSSVAFCATPTQGPATHSACLSLSPRRRLHSCPHHIICHAIPFHLGPNFNSTFENISAALLFSSLFRMPMFLFLCRPLSRSLFHCSTAQQQHNHHHRFISFTRM